MILRKLRRRNHKPGTEAVPTGWLRNQLREYLCDHLLVGHAHIYELVDRQIVESTVKEFLRDGSMARPVGQLLSCELALQIYGL